MQHPGTQALHKAEVSFELPFGPSTGRGKAAKRDGGHRHVLYAAREVCRLVSFSAVFPRTEYAGRWRRSGERRS